MKKQILLLLFCVVLLNACFVNRNLVSYEFPDAMSDEVRAAYTEQCDKGKVLFEINCSKCHYIKKGRRTLIPDFDQSELIGYEMRVMNPQHESEVREARVNAEELGLIMTFLTYKRKNATD